jgi:hypothetical protein
MAAPMKYPDELRERATRTAVEAGAGPGHPRRRARTDRQAVGHQPRDAAHLSRSSTAD